MDKTLRESIINELKQIIISELHNENVRVYLFGSWARNEEKKSSDIDIAIEEREQLPLSKWLHLIEHVEESTIPYKVDIMKLNEASQEIRENIKREGVIWKD